MATSRSYLIINGALLLALALPAFGYAMCPNSERLRKLEQLSLRTHSSLLLDCNFYHHERETSSFLLLEHGRSREFSADPKYSKTSGPALSPDARSIAYAGYSEGMIELVIIDVPAGTARVIRSTHQNLDLWGWDQDGSHLMAYNDQLRRLELVNAREGATERSIPLPVNRNTVYRPTPNLRWIAMEEDQDHPERVYVIKEKLFLASLSKGERKFVANGWESAWSPQGDKLAYLTPDEMACYLLALSSGRSTRLFRSLNFSKYIYQEELSGPLVWSPDQRFLVFHQSAGLKNSDRTAYIYDFKRRRRHKYLSAGVATIVDWR
jgi:Tol biopolymer transport system component